MFFFLARWKFQSIVCRGHTILIFFKQCFRVLISLRCCCPLLVLAFWIYRDCSVCEGESHCGFYLHLHQDWGCGTSDCACWTLVCLIWRRFYSSLSYNFSRLPFYSRVVQVLHLLRITDFYQIYNVYLFSSILWANFSLSG